MKGIIGLLYLFSTAAIASSNIEVSTGEAFNSSGQLVYHEQHKTTLTADGKHVSLTTEYFNPSKKPIGKITSNFLKSPFLPEYSFEDYRFERKAGTKWSNGSLTAYSQPDKESQLQQQQVEVKDSMVTGQGLHVYILEHLDEIIASDNTKKIKFLIPLNQDYYNFRIRKKAFNKDSKELKIIVEIDNWLLRLIAPNIELKYDTQNKRLLEYYGASNLLASSKDTQVVRIKYTYPDEEPKEKKES